MSLVTGTNSGVIIEDKPDSDGELNISIDGAEGCEINDSWLTKKMAIDVIEHLSKAFNLTHKE